MRTRPLPPRDPAAQQFREKGVGRGVGVYVSLLSVGEFGPCHVSLRLRGSNYGRGVVVRLVSGLLESDEGGCDALDSLRNDLSRVYKMPGYIQCEIGVILTYLLHDS